MGIKKQEFYEGAALYQLARTNSLAGVRYESPFFILANSVFVLIKYCTKNRSPWPFTVTKDEQECLKAKSSDLQVVLALVCGADGIVALPYIDYVSIAPERSRAIRISCYRKHRELYEVNGPSGVLPRKISPSAWQRMIWNEGKS